VYPHLREAERNEKGRGEIEGWTLRVTVYAASSRQSPESFLAAGRAIGKGLAERGHTLVYGGATVGVMGALAAGSLDAGGRVEGVILDEFSSVAHPDLDALETVDTMRARKAGLAERGDAFIALPGALGTLEELSEILVERQLGFHAKPVYLLNLDGFWSHLLSFFDRQVDDGILTAENRRIAQVFPNVLELLAALDASVPAAAAAPERPKA
jgi:uncharacterized protein (TIGR00730 family)